MNTNASNHTQFFGFPLFAGTDKPSVLTDWNGTMEELDATLEDYRVRIAGCEQTTTSFMDQVNILKDRFTQVEARISADEGLIQDNAIEIAALKEAVIVADTSIKRILTDLGNLEPQIINEVNSLTSSLQNSVNAQITQVNAEMENLSNTVDAVSDRVDIAVGASEDLLALYPRYSDKKTYKMGDIVSSDSKALYMSLSDDNRGNALTNISYWLQTSLARLNETYASFLRNANDAYSLARTAEVYGIKALATTSAFLEGLGINEYDNSIEYRPGDKVYRYTYNGAVLGVYACLQTTRGNTPAYPSDAYWKILYYTSNVEDNFIYDMFASKETEVAVSELNAALQETNSKASAAFNTTSQINAPEGYPTGSSVIRQGDWNIALTNYYSGGVSRVNLGQVINNIINNSGDTSNDFVVKVAINYLSGTQQVNQQKDFIVRFSTNADPDSSILDDHFYNRGVHTQFVSGTGGNILSTANNTSIVSHPFVKGQSLYAFITDDSNNSLALNGGTLTVTVCRKA